MRHNSFLSPIPPHTFIHSFIFRFGICVSVFDWVGRNRRSSDNFLMVVWPFVRKNHSTWSNERLDIKIKRRRSEKKKKSNHRNLRPNRKFMNLSIRSRAEAYKCFTCWLIVLKRQNWINVLAAFERQRTILFFLSFFSQIHYTCSQANVLWC